MANSEDCASRGSSGWDIAFAPGGEYWLKKHGQSHTFPDHDSVRHFLMGYEVAHDVYNVEEGRESNTATLIFDIDCSAAGKATEELAKLKEAVDALTESYDRLNYAQNGPVEYSGATDSVSGEFEAIGKLIKELLAGVK